MEVKKKKRSKFDINKKYLWSPNVNWKKSGEELSIEEYCFTGTITNIFPELYFRFQEGITPVEFIQQMQDINSKELESILQDLVTKKILVSSILTPSEIFMSQTKLLESEYTEEMFLDPNEVEKYKKSKLNRVLPITGKKTIELKQIDEYPSIINERKSYRIFNASEKVGNKEFNQIMSIFRQIRKDDEIRYYYASAGGLYPIDIYLYVKDDRVEGISGGLYCYSPINNSIELISDSCVITEEAHFFTNKEIFTTSAFSIFFVYNADVSMPKYGGMAYFYACIDSGIMVGALTASTELNNIGLCSIGNMEFDKIKKYFKLNENQVLIHTIEVGLKLD